MATHERINEKTPNGGDYSEIFYFDKDGNAVDETAKAEYAEWKKDTEQGLKI